MIPGIEERELVSPLKSHARNANEIPYCIQKMFDG